MKFLSTSALFLTVILTAGCRRHEPAASPQKDPAAEVKTASTLKRKVALSEEITGTVRARTRAVIEGRISGRILRITTGLGQSVKAGEVLAVLDAQETKARVESAAAALDQATRDERRAASLLGSRAISAQDYDAAKARMDMAKAAVSEAQTMMGYGEVTAPFAGVITRKLADQGELAAPGKPLLELEDPAQLRVEADVPESLVARIRQGMKLAIRSTGSPDTSAAVAEISPAGDPNSRTFPVKLDLPADSGLRPGQFVRLSVPVGESEAILVPTAAVVRRGQLELVFVHDAGTARLRLVRTGRLRDGEIEVLAGLEGTESVVIAGADRLRDGQPVKILP